MALTFAIEDKGILPDRMIAALAAAGGILPVDRFRARPDPAGEPRPAAGRGRLSRARELPAGPHHGRRAHRRAEAARIRAQRRRGAGDRLRLYRAAAGKPGAARRHFRRRQSEKLDRPARRVHPRHRRRNPRLRPHRGRLSRAALCRDQPAHLSGAGARGLAAVADPLPPRPCAARRRRAARPACARAAGRRRRRRCQRRRRGRRRSVGPRAGRPGRLSRQAPHRPDRRRAARRLRGARFLGADAGARPTRA